VKGLALIGATLAGVGGCAFDPSGVAWDGAGGGPADGPTDTDIDAAAGTPDARPPTADAAVSGDGLLISRRTTVPPTLDANPSDWSQASWVGYAIADSALFAWRHTSYDDSAAIQFASLHDDQYIYFFFDVTDDLIRIDSTSLFEDDAVNIYIDAAGDRSGPYGADDHELVVDAAGTYDDYAVGAAPLTLSGQVMQTGTGYRIELRISKTSLGASPLPSNLGFDVAITDDDGFGNSDSDCYGLWYVAARQHCTACCSGGAQAWCDTSVFGRLVLE